MLLAKSHEKNFFGGVELQLRIIERARARARWAMGVTSGYSP